jgi:hypothetical protein
MKIKVLIDCTFNNNNLRSLLVRFGFSLQVLSLRVRSESQSLFVVFLLYDKNTTQFLTFITKSTVLQKRSMF